MSLLALGLLSDSLASLLLAALVLGLDRETGNEASHASLVFLVLRVLAGADRFGETNATLEDEQKAQDTNAGPLDVGFSAVAVPEVKSEPDGLLTEEVRVTRQGPETTDDEAALQILGLVPALVLVRDASSLLVVVLGSLEVPLLLVGEVLDDNEEEGHPGEDKVRNLEGLVVRQTREKEEVVGRGGDQKQEQGLRQADEDDVENEEDKAVVDLGADDLPTVVFRAD